MNGGAEIARAVSQQNSHVIVCIVICCNDILLSVTVKIPYRQGGGAVSHIDISCKVKRSRAVTEQDRDLAVHDRKVLLPVTVKVAHRDRSATAGIVTGRETKLAGPVAQQNR